MASMTPIASITYLTGRAAFTC